MCDYDEPANKRHVPAGEGSFFELCILYLLHEESASVSISGAPRAPRQTWPRERVVRCFCPEKKYAHVHCPCQTCNDSAVSKSVKMKHWKKSQALYVSTYTQRGNLVHQCIRYLYSKSGCYTKS